MNKKYIFIFLYSINTFLMNFNISTKFNRNGSLQSKNSQKNSYINESEIGSVIECNIFFRCGNQIVGTAYIIGTINWQIKDIINKAETVDV